MSNLDAITDDIRQVMEVLRNQPEGSQAVGRIVQLTVSGGADTSATIGPGAFDLGAEIAKETKRALSSSVANDAADARELSRYHDETMRLIGKYGFEPVCKVIVQCRNQALREGKL